jgi:HK97 family phage portal protein
MSKRSRRRARAIATRQNPAGEGNIHGAPYLLPITGGWLGQEGDFANWWQLGYNPRGTGEQSAIVEACVSAYSQTVAMCPGTHWRSNAKNGRDRVTNSALSRIIRQPNDYQSISDFLLNAVRSLYTDGNTYALALRSDRYETAEIHLMDPVQCRGAVSVTGEVFYELAGNNVIERRLGPLGWVPARDVLHIKLHTRNRWDPLRGMSPLFAAVSDIAMGDAIASQQLRFYTNMARPSFVLATDLLLDKDQVEALRQRWEEKTRGLGAGGTPILTGGVKPVPITVTGRDAQMAEILKATEQHIALAYRIPLQILGIASSQVSSTEALMQAWIASGLGFCLNHVEEAFGLHFGLKGYPDDYLEFDTAALLRSAFKDRIDGLTKGISGGLFSSNEARNTEGYPSVRFGDEPLSFADKIPAAPSAEAAPAAGAAPQPAPAPPIPSGDKINATALARGMLQRSARY